MSKLPKGWISIKLGRVISLEYGKSLPKHKRKSGDIPVYGSNGVVGYHNKALADGPGIIVGRKGSHGELAWSDNSFFPIDTTYFVSNSNAIDLRFTFHLLSSLDLKTFNRSTAIPGLNRNDAYNISIPLPPLNEQKRIVAKLDLLFAHLDGLNTRLERVPELLKQFRQSVLTQAVTGKLTEDWRAGKILDPVSIYLKKVGEKRLEESKVKRIKNLKIKLRGDLELYDIPEPWEWCDLEFLMNENSSFCYGVVQPGEDVDNQQKLIRVKDLRQGKILMENLRGISYEIDANYERSKVENGDLLISVVGTIGRTAMVTENESGFNIARAIAKISIKDFDTEYVKLFIDSTIGQFWLVDDAREVARKTLNLDQLRTLPIPVPPLAEQQEIVRRVEALFEKADLIERQYELLKEKIEHLPQAILAKAFRGELVPQDPNDEPAEELLHNVQRTKSNGLPKQEPVAKASTSPETKAPLKNSKGPTDKGSKGRPLPKQLKLDI